MAENDSQVSVVIPAYNEATYIDRLLTDLTEQTFKDFEVVVSDAESHDGIDKVVDRFKSRLDIRLVESPPRGPAAGRNAGAAIANGEWLLFLDADDEIEDHDHIASLLSAAKQNNWATVSARMRVRDGSHLQRFGTWLDYHYIKLLAHTKHPVAPGWCILTKRAMFEEYGGFNEKIQLGEDYDYVSRVGSLGFGFTDNTYYYLDLRRVREDGLKFIIKGILNEFYRHTHHYNLEKNPYKYDFGKHRKRT